MFSGLLLQRERPELLSWHPGISVSAQWDPIALYPTGTPHGIGSGDGVPAFPGSWIFPAGSVPAATLTTVMDLSSEEKIHLFSQDFQAHSQEYHMDVYPYSHPGSRAPNEAPKFPVL